MWESTGNFTYQFTHQLKAAVHHCVSLGFDVLFWASWTLSKWNSYCLKMVWVNLVHCCSPAMDFLVIHTTHGQYAWHPSVSEHSPGTNPLGSTMGNVSIVSCVEHSKVCFKQIGQMWKTPKVFLSARTVLHHYPRLGNSIICALTYPFSRAHNLFSDIIVFWHSTAPTACSIHLLILFILWTEKTPKPWTENTDC